MIYSENYRTTWHDTDCNRVVRPTSILTHFEETSNLHMISVGQPLDKVRDERVDVILANHPEQTGTLEKMVKIFNGDTDVFEPDEWDVLLGKLERAINKICETDPE